MEETVRKTEDLRISNGESGNGSNGTSNTPRVSLTEEDIEEEELLTLIIPAEEEDDLEGLTLYDRCRKPLSVLDDVITIPIRNITQELVCPICLGMIDGTMTVMECLHRFCYQCLNFSVSKANKRNCPSCRAKVASLRNARTDTNFDNIINALFPDRDEYEEHMESLLSKITDDATKTSKSLVQQVEEGLKRQAEAKKLAKAKRKLAKKKLKYNTPSHASLYGDDINFKLEQHPKASFRGLLKQPWVDTSSQATINAVRKLLANIIFHSPEKYVDVQISVKKDGDDSLDLEQLVKTPGELTLKEVYDKFWQTPNEKLVLYYWNTPPGFISSPPTLSLPPTLPPSGASSTDTDALPEVNK